MKSKEPWEQKAETVYKQHDLLKRVSEIQRTLELLNRCYIKAYFNQNCYYVLAIIDENNKPIKRLEYDCCPLNPEIKQAMKDELKERRSRLIKEFDEI